MADVLRIKRRVSGSPGAPTSLANAELAYNEVDHTLYYGEGTGGAGGTASVVVAIGGSGVASNANPIMDGAVSPGNATQWSRGDHVHPTDTSRYAASNPSGYQTAGQVTAALSPYALLASPTFTGTVTMAGLTVNGTVSGAGFTTLLAPYAPLASPVFTGVPAGPTASPGANTTQLATTAFVTAAGAAFLVSPAFTGTPTAPTAPPGTNTTQLATTAFAMAIRQDQQAVPTASVSWNNQYLINLLDPQNAQDAATKHYVDNAAQGLQSKAAVAAATTGANITLSGTQTIDGVALNVGDRVLVKDQAATANNGLYVVGSGAWSRTADMDTWAEVPQAYVFVQGGALNANSSWTCSSQPGGTLGTTAITWVQFSQAATINPGNGLNKVGNVLNVLGTAGRIAVGTNVDIDPAYSGQASITMVGSVGSGNWVASTIMPMYGGTGATSLTGYVKGHGSISPFTAVNTIPNTDIAGLGTMALQNAVSVAITGGTIDGITLDCGVF